MRAGLGGTHGDARPKWLGKGPRECRVNYSDAGPRRSAFLRALLFREIKAWRERDAGVAAGDAARDDPGATARDFARWFVWQRQLFPWNPATRCYRAGLKIPGAIRFGWHELHVWAVAPAISYFQNCSSGESFVQPGARGFRFRLHSIDPPHDLLRAPPFLRPVAQVE